MRLIPSLEFLRAGAGLRIIVEACEPAALRIRAASENNPDPLPTSRKLLPSSRSAWRKAVSDHLASQAGPVFAANRSPRLIGLCAEATDRSDWFHEETSDAQTSGSTSSRGHLRSGADRRYPLAASIASAAHGRRHVAALFRSKLRPSIVANDSATPGGPSLTMMLAYSRRATSRARSSSPYA